MALLENGELYRRYDEDVHPGMRLGRNLWLDARSLAYMIENNAGAMTKPLSDQHWTRELAILDQGDLGSCTGNAGTGALGTQPFYDAIGRSVLTDAHDTERAEKFAIQLYSDATVIDGYPGAYPPEDTGSSGLAICQVLRSRGTIAGYRWARTPYGLLQLLQNGPVLQGMPWYEAFFTPDAQGFIDSGPWESSDLAGGHEIEAVGCEIDTADVFNSVIIYANSWGTGWADNGYFRMRLRTYEKLTNVDIKQFRL